MRIWFQLLSSEQKMKSFIDTVQQLVDRAAEPGTTFEVRGTSQGVLGDQYRLFFQYDLKEVLDNGLKIRQEGGYDAFAIANSLDPALVDLREMLNIPVLSFMETNCFTACTMGERFGIIVPNRKMVPRYREIALGYGLRDRLATIEPILFDDVRAQEDAFTNPDVAASVEKQMIAATRRAAEKGAEVVFAAGPPGALMAQRGIFEVDGVPILDSYTLLAKTAEMRVRMHKLSGVCVSRHCLYESPSSDLVRKVGEAYGVKALLGG
jgi:Asp/Glu/hydantoin racemase